MMNKIGNGIIARQPQAKSKKECQIIAITSGKGGVGKSTVSVNMAIMLQKMKKKVLLIDADVHLGNVDLLMGLRTKYTIADVVSNGRSLQDIIIKGPGNVDILPASSASVELIDMEDQLLKTLANSFTQLDHDYDIILIDTGAGIAKTVISFLLGADKIIVIISPDPASIADAYAVIKVVKNVKNDIPVVLIPNKVKSQEEAETIHKKMNLMVRKFLNSKLEFGGCLLRDELIAKSIKKQRPFVLDHPNSVSANSIRVFNRRLLQMSDKEKSDTDNLFNRFIQNRKIEYEWNV